MPLGSIVGGIIGAGGASAAGAAAGASGVQAYQNALQIAGGNKALASPYLTAGYAGTNALLRAEGLGHLTGFNTDGGPESTMYGETSLDQSNPAADRAGAVSDFRASPGYTFRVQQGVNALDRSAAAKGMTLSGAQAKELNDYGQGQADSEWDKYIAQLQGLSGTGATTTAGVNNADTSALNSGNALEFQGNMGRASSYSNAANALASGIGNGINSAASLASFGLGGGFGGGAAASPNPIPAGSL